MMDPTITTGRPTRPGPVRRIATKRRPFLLALAVILLGTAGARSALAWGRIGHRAAGKIAEARLTPAALAAIRDLLEPGESLADVSNWADEVRRDRPESGPWHYVNVPVTAPRYSETFCPAEGCVVGKIDDFRRALADRNAPKSARREALLFLVHFVQDVHQPLHVGDRGDRGGNDFQVQFFDKGSNLHRVWDSGLIERAYRNEVALARELDASTDPKLSAEWATGTPVDWANESLQAARQAYNQPGTDTPLKKGARLGEPYLAANLPVAKKRIAQAGVRLASVLNATFAPPAP